MAYRNELPPAFEDKHLIEISRKLGNYPLYLQKIAGASVNYMSTRLILEDIDGRSHMASLLRRAPSEPMTPLESVNEIAFSELPNASLRLLCVMAYLNGNYISEELLLSSNELRVDIGCGDSFTMRETIHPLLEKGLAYKKLDGLSINSDLQFDVLRRLDRYPTIRDLYFMSACILIYGIISSLEGSLQKLVSCSSGAVHYAIQHGMSLYENFRQTSGPKRVSLAFARILCSAGQECWAQMSITKGNSLLEAALEIIQALRDQRRGAPNASEPRFAFDSYDQSLAARRTAQVLEGDVCALLGVISSQNGVEGRQASMAYRRTALQMRLKRMKHLKSACCVTRQEERRLQNSYSDISIGLLYREDFGGADRVIEICRSHYEDWDPAKTELSYEYAKYYFVKSFTLMAAGNSTQALRASQRAVDLLGEESYNTWLHSHYRFVRATMYFYAGQPFKALEMHEAILTEGSRHFLQVDEIRHIERVYMVAALSYFLGDYGRASQAALKQSHHQTPGPVIQSPGPDSQHKCEGIPSWVKQTSRKTSSDTRAQPWKNTFGETVDCQLGDEPELVTVEDPNSTHPFRRLENTVAA
ncbi:hypothetical protein F5Y13DRAFT_206787 [Hypoxylon sp. FL1857]|nr:hypothetical protein F5Y13DRAFT_206787 [Hypoxylon sp. FL1857]